MCCLCAVDPELQWGRARNTAHVAAWGCWLGGAFAPVVASTYNAGLRDKCDVGWCYDVMSC